MENNNDFYTSQTLKNAVDAIRTLPGIGSRSALRLALHLLKETPEDIKRFASSINALADDIHYCTNCGMICDSELCPVCSSTERDRNVICVVESVRDVMSIEQTGQYKGTYHILGGIISPIDGIGPSDLNLRQLYSRLTPQTEVIMALSGDVEGETTAFYVFRQIEKFGCKVTTLARGLGFGDALEYADSLTLGRSIRDRQPFIPR